MTSPGNVFEEDAGLHSYGLLTPQHGVEDFPQQDQLPGKVTHAALGLTLFIGNQPSRLCGHALDNVFDALAHCEEGLVRLDIRAGTEVDIQIFQYQEADTEVLQSCLATAFTNVCRDRKTF